MEAHENMQEGVAIDGAHVDVWEVYANDYGVTFHEKTVAEYIYLYGCPIMLLLGTIGNIATVVRFVTMCQKVLSTILYLLVVAIMDLVVLYERCGNAWIQAIIDYDFEYASMQWSNTVCKIFPFLSNFSYHLSVWLLVAMAVETTLVAFRPHRLLKIYNLERARAVFLLIVVLLVCVNAHCFWTYALISADKSDKNSEEICESPNPKERDSAPRVYSELYSSTTSARDGDDDFRRVTWPAIDILLGDLLPYLIIFACTVMLITRQSKGHTRSREVDNIWRSYTCDAAAARSFHSTIIALCVMYDVLMLPKLACSIFLFLVEPSGFWLVRYSFVFRSKKMLAKAICMMCHYVFISCKFLLYLSLSKEYRRGFRGQFCRNSCHNNLKARHNHTTMNHHNHRQAAHGGVGGGGAQLHTYNANCNHNSEETSSLVESHQHHQDKPYSITAV